MKKMLASFAVAGLLGLGVAVASPMQQEAQPPSEATAHNQGHRPDPKRQVEILTRKLNLTNDQQSQLLPILTDRQQQVEALRKNTSMPRQEMRTKMRAIRTDSRARIEALLTPEQKTAFADMEQNSGRSEAPAPAPQN